MRWPEKDPDAWYLRFAWAPRSVEGQLIWLEHYWQRSWVWGWGFVDYEERLYNGPNPPSILEPR